MAPRVKSKGQCTARKQDQAHSKWFTKWEQVRHTICKVCEKEGTDENNKLLGCAYCVHRTHVKCDSRQLNNGRKKWNTYQCEGCVETFKHPKVREEERARNITSSMSTTAADIRRQWGKQTTEMRVTPYYHVLAARSQPMSTGVQYKKIH